MLKAYVCYVCLGKGEVWTTDFDEEGNTTEPCPDCIGRGLPAKVELPVNGPPSAKEYTVETQVIAVPVTRTLDGDVWKQEETK